MGRYHRTKGMLASVHQRFIRKPSAHGKANTVTCTCCRRLLHTKRAYSQHLRCNPACFVVVRNAATASTDNAQSKPVGDDSVDSSVQSLADNIEHDPTSSVVDENGEEGYASFDDNEQQELPVVWENDSEI